MQFAKANAVVAWSGGTMVLRANQSIDDDHPLLAERPDLFTEGDDQAEIRHTPVRRGPIVETARQAPGGDRVLRTPKTGGSGQ